MVGTLIESRGHRQRRTGGSLASIVLHTALIASAVVGTARESINANILPARTVYVDLPSLPRETPRQVVAPSTRAAVDVLAMPTIPKFDAPEFVPTEIPPIDLTATPTTADFSERRSHTSGVLCSDPCPRVGLGGDGTGQSPVWAVNDVIMQLLVAPTPPRYPERLRHAGVEGTVLVKFVVDTLGRVDPASIEVLRSTHDLFAVAVRESLAKLRFNPAVVGNRKIPATAMMPFQFTLK